MSVVTSMTQWKVFPVATVTPDRHGGHKGERRSGRFASILPHRMLRSTSGR